MGIEGNPTARPLWSGEPSIEGLSSARAQCEPTGSDGETCVEQTAVWEGARRACRVAWRCLPADDHCGCREWHVSCPIRRRETATTAPAGRRRTRVAVWPGGRPAGRADPRRLGRLADVAENPRHRGSLDEKATMRQSAPQFGQTSGRDGNGPHTVGAGRLRAGQVSLRTSALRFSAAARQLGCPVRSGSKPAYPGRDHLRPQSACSGRH
jgi:hypothetical protein